MSISCRLFVHDMTKSWSSFVYDMTSHRLSMIWQMCCNKWWVNIYIYISHVYMTWRASWSSFVYDMSDMGWLHVVGSLELQVSSAKEPYERDDILQNRPMKETIFSTFTYTLVMYIWHDEHLEARLSMTWHLIISDVMCAHLSMTWHVAHTNQLQIIGMGWLHVVGSSNF